MLHSRMLAQPINQLFAFCFWGFFVLFMFGCTGEYEHKAEQNKDKTYKETPYFIPEAFPSSPYLFAEINATLGCHCRTKYQ